MRTVHFLTPLVLAACATAPAAPPDGGDDERYGVAEMRTDAAELAPLYPEPWVARWLAATDQLPEIAPRTVMRKGEKTTVDETGYYAARFGSPLAYARAYQVLAQAGLEDVAGKRILDFGYGQIGQLQLLARIGADVVGVDVSEFGHELYSFPGDQGKLGEGQLRLVLGYFPRDAETIEAVGGGYHVILSKNVLKRGYIHPEQEVDPKMLVHLGVDDAAFLERVAAALEPGGLFLVYNICPPPNAPGRKYRPWADGRSPFSKEAYEAAGFEVLSIDVEDDEAMRAMGRKLDWPNVETDFFAMYTLVRKR